MLSDALLQFVQNEKNSGMEFVRQATVHGGGAHGVYLYGAGVQKLYVVRFLQKHRIKIKAILDTFQQGVYEGIPILRFDDFLRGNPDPESWFVISSPSVEREIRETLERHFRAEHIFQFETSPYVEWIPDVEKYRTYLVECWNELSLLHDALADEASKKTLINIIKGRISGKTDYFREIYVPDKYYPAGVFRFSGDEILAEVGSYDGKTLLDFLRHCPDYKAAYCFEPDQKNLRTLNRVVEETRQNGKIKVISKGAWDCKTTLRFNGSGGATNLSHAVEEASLEDSLIEVTTIDDVICEPVTYMTVSINGAELRVLYGAERQIQKNRPKLAVCVSYSGEGLLDVWNYLRELVPEYRFYLRHHLEHGGVESFLYST